MKTASALLTSILGSGQFLMADLFTFTLVNGTVQRITSYDVPLKSGGNTFVTSPRIKRGKTHWKIGLDVDELDLEVYPQASDLVGALSWQAAMQQGVFDGATLELDRAFMKPDGVMKVTVTNPGSGYSSPPTVVFSGGGGSGAAGTAVLSGNTVASVTMTNCGSNYSSAPSVQFQGGGGANAAGTAALGSPTDTSAGTLITFAGRVAECDFGRNGVTFKINSHLELLNVNMPRNLYQPGCVHTLYDAGCTLTKATFTFTGTVGAGATVSTLPIAGTGQGDGYYALGTVKLTSGANAGLSRSVKSWAGGVATLLSPLPAAPANGDGVQIAAGCDKQQATCNTKFANLANFRGFPYVPVPETTT